jgi:hypothetical protein
MPEVIVMCLLAKMLHHRAHVTIKGLRNSSQRKLCRLQLHCGYIEKVDRNLSC